MFFQETTMFRTRVFPGLGSAVVSLVLVATLAADDPPGKRPPGPKGPPAAHKAGEGGPKLPGPFRLPPHVSLSAEQQRALQGIYDELGPRWKALDEEWKALMTEELRGAERAAREEARRQGLRGPQEHEFVEAALPLTPEQRAVRNDLQEARKQLDDIVTARIRELLTPEQLSAAGPRFRVKGEKPVPPKGRGADRLRQGPPPAERPTDAGLDSPPVTREDR
jgi:hypothetical protein